ncbi:MAG: ABC transporter permease [Bryobacteraceae bacterium]
MGFLGDLRFGLRLWRRSPGFTATAVLTLALGIGANTAIFSVVDAALLRPLPYRDASRLAMVWDQLPKLGIERLPTSFGNYYDYLRGNHVFSSLAAFSYVNLTVENGGIPQRLQGMAISASLLGVLGVEPEFGRGFQDNDTRVAILSHSLWLTRYGADRAVIGRTILINDALRTIIGVMPAGFAFTTQPANRAEIWVPLEMRADPQRATGDLLLIGRLKPGVTVAAARAGMDALGRNLEQTYHLYRGPHGEDAGYRVAVAPLREELFGRFRMGLLVLAGAVGCLLLIACVNVAGLMLARSEGRRQEMTIRSALGAGRLRLVCQLLSESLALALTGGTLGVLLAAGSVGALVRLGPAAIPALVNVRVDVRVLVFTLILCGATGLLSGLTPAFAMTRPQRGARVAGARSRLGGPLVAAETALAVSLLIGAGLLVESFVRLTRVNPGFNPGHVLTLRVFLPEARYGDARRMALFYEELVDRVTALPGVISAAASSRLPLSGGRGGDPFSVEGRIWNSRQAAHFQVTGRAYFPTMQIPLLAGRLPTGQDTAGAPLVAVINRKMADTLWPAENPLGKRIMMGAPRPGARWLTIVGVVGDVQDSSLEAAPIAQIYAPLAQAPGTHAMHLVVKTAADPLAEAPAVASQVQSIDASLPVYGVDTLDRQLENSVAQPRFQSLLLGLFAATALALAAIGLYGIVSHRVALRTREIGVRMALGAGARDVVLPIVRQSMTPVAAGIALGAALTFALSKVLASLLFATRPADPAAFGCAALVLGAVTTAACLLPARRAARIDPAAALRRE